MRGAVVQQRKQLLRLPVSPLPQRMPQDTEQNQPSWPGACPAHQPQRETDRDKADAAAVTPQCAGFPEAPIPQGVAGPWPLGAHSSAEKAGHCQGFINAYKAGWIVTLKWQESHKRGLETCPGGRERHMS